jgi:predicted nucleic acid-binding protein
MTIILDTSYLIAYVNGKDVNHKRARQLQEDITKKKYGAVLVPDAVFSEFVTLLRRKARDKRTAVAEGI